MNAMPVESTVDVQLQCRGVWKLFGHKAGKFLRENNQPSKQDIAREGLIAAVCDVNLDIRANEIFVIMGLSGSGKSTLVRCMARLLEPTCGEILFNRENLLTATPQRMIEIRRHKMGMVFQHFALLPHLNVLDNVAFPLEVQGAGRRDREARATQMIKLVGLEGREYFFPNELSGGQQQRVGIARSLSVEPDIWFLDEPFSALDPLIRREMQDEFIRIQSMLKKTIVFITHDFDEAIRVADRIAIMKDGVVVQIGSPEELVMNPLDGYVSEFTRNVAKAKVIRVLSIMQPLPAEAPRGGYAGEVSLNQRVSEVVPLFENDHAVLRVVDEAGEVVGCLPRDQVVRIVMQA